jgi:hypothetical protein
MVRSSSLSSLESMNTCVCVFEHLYVRMCVCVYMWCMNGRVFQGEVCRGCACAVHVHAYEHLCVHACVPRAHVHTCTPW